MFLQHNQTSRILGTHRTLALFYHLCNGIRHLFWDAGYGFELDVAYRSGLAVLGASVALTLISWILGYSFAAP